jgi:hypothetical protein
LTIEGLRRPLFVAAYLALFVAVALEGGSCVFSKPARAIGDDLVAGVIASYDDDAPSRADVRRDMERAQRANTPAPGYGIPHLGLFDGILLLVMTWMALALVLPRTLQGIQGRVQGVVTLLLAIGFFSAALTVAFTTFARLVAMISLIAASPFGFAAYMAIWGSFQTKVASAILAASMSLKIAFAVLLVLAHPQFLKVKSMLLVVVTSLVLAVITQWLIFMVPRPLASITDAVAGIVNAIVTAAWAIVLAVMSLVGVWRAIRVDRGLAGGEGA